MKDYYADNFNRNPRSKASKTITPKPFVNANGFSTKDEMDQNEILYNHLKNSNGGILPFSNG